MADNYVPALMSLLEKSMGSNQYLAEESVKIVQMLSEHVKEETQKMSAAIKEMTGVVEMMAEIMENATLLITLPEQKEKQVITESIPEGRLTTEEEALFKQPFIDRVSVPAAFWLRPVGSDAGKEELFLVIDEEDGVITYCFYDRNMNTIKSGELDKEDLSFPVLFEKLMGTDLASYVSYQVDPEVVISRIPVLEESLDTHEQQEPSEDLAVKEQKLSGDMEEELEPDQREMRGREHAAKLL